MAKRKNAMYGYVLSVLIMGIVGYPCLVVGDYYLQYLASSKTINSTSEPKQIEYDRIIKQDVPQKKIAQQEGYQTLFFPETIDTYLPLKKLAKKLDAAPLAPQPQSKLYFCNEGYGLIKYQTDRFGFRNSDALWDEKIDLVLIGDSFAHGACVSEKESIAGGLNAKLKTLNLASYGNHAIHYAALEKIFIPLLKPKYVVTIFYANDNEDDEDSLIYDAYFKRNQNYFEIQNGQLQLSKNLVDFYAQSTYLIENLLSDNSPQEFIKINAQISAFEKSLKYFSLPTIRRTVDNYLKVQGWKSALPSSNRLAIDLLASECQKNGCTPIIGYIPNHQFWRPDARTEHYVKLLEQYARKQKIAFIDFTKILQVGDPGSYASAGYHLSPEGYQLVSQSILSHLGK